MIKKNLLLFVFLFVLVPFVSAQNEYDIVDVLGIRTQVDSLERRIDLLIKCSPYLMSRRGLKQYHILKLYASSPADVECLFDDVDNIRNLSCCYSYRKPFLGIYKNKRYIDATTFVCDSSGTILAIGNWRKLYRIKPRMLQTRYKGDNSLVKSLKSGFLSCAFTLGVKDAYGLIGMSFSRYGICQRKYCKINVDYKNGTINFISIENEVKEKCIKGLITSFDLLP